MPASAGVAAVIANAHSQLDTESGADGFKLRSLREVFEVLDGKGAGIAERRVVLLKRLPDILDAIGLGFEPDKRFGPPLSMGDDTMLCLYPADGAVRPIESRAEYRAARTMVEIAVLAALADGVVVEAELQAIVADLARIAALDDSDRRRLRAHAHALVANPPKLRAATKRLLELSEAEKTAVIDAAVHAVLADHRVLPAEVRFLEGLYKALGKQQDEIYARLHAGNGAAPPAHGSQLGLRQIDGARLTRIREETAAVSTMLASIFREDEAAAPVTAKPIPDAAEHTLPGLDAAHTRILVALTEQPIEEDAFEALCREQRLLPQGAIETINDWGFDAFDEAAIENDDLVCIQPHLIATIRTMATA